MRFVEKIHHLLELKCIKIKKTYNLTEENRFSFRLVNQSLLYLIYDDDFYDLERDCLNDNDIDLLKSTVSDWRRLRFMHRNYELYRDKFALIVRDTYAGKSYILYEND